MEDGISSLPESSVRKSGWRGYSSVYPGSRLVRLQFSFPVKPSAQLVLRVW